MGFRLRGPLAWIEPCYQTLAFSFPTGHGLCGGRPMSAIYESRRGWVLFKSSIYL